MTVPMSTAISPTSVVGSPVPLPLTVIVYGVSVHGLLKPATLTLYVPLGVVVGTENVKDDPLLEISSIP